jgi:hypothetical protein
MADIVLISPRFEPSYWGVDYAAVCNWVGWSRPS